MKLTKYQKKIIDKIIAGEVYDIPSFLRVFNKGREKQYDAAEIRAVFNKCENGVKYMYKQQEDNSFLTDFYDSNGNIYQTLPVPNKTTIELYSYPILTPVNADLSMKITPEEVVISDVCYRFDFLKSKYLIADSFSEIRDFVALWSYLRREALVFEGSKNISEEDISVFFELVEKDIKPQENPYWSTNVEPVPGTENDPMSRLNITMVPRKNADHYIKKVWKFNRDEFSMYKDYVGVKMMPTSDLKNYQQGKYKTVEEKAQNRNLFVAWIAVIVSVVSILVGNIIPMFQPSEIDSLNEIGEQLYSIEQVLDSINENDTIYLELQEIEETLDQITSKINDNSSHEIKALIEDLLEQLKEIKTNVQTKP